MRLGWKVGFSSFCRNWSISTPRLDADTIVNCVSDSLLAAEILLSRLDRNMPKEKLDLLKFAASNMA
jgi:hypothetical protein